MPLTPTLELAFERLVRTEDDLEKLTSELDEPAWGPVFELVPAPAPVPALVAALRSETEADAETGFDLEACGMCVEEEDAFGVLGIWTVEAPEKTDVLDFTVKILLLGSWLLLCRLSLECVEKSFLVLPLPLRALQPLPLPLLTSVLVEDTALLTSTFGMRFELLLDSVSGALILPLWALLLLLLLLMALAVRASCCDRCSGSP